ncbi:hypothetical protein WICPIJ_009728 [Wickerhamomyces pijperi]|uniref:Uncharacterized protein n=1 Tax=Wickerhamomyces pijperi TaxID=599730 RepID=A0A9P8TCU6_WICPI|nr:hypothetical protein WICPIJ_009728 [Wickerhamomyces pijperi]
MVPLGIDLEGFLKSPDIEAPAKIPAVAGKKIPNRSWNVSLPGSSDPAAPCVNSGNKFERTVSHVGPVYSSPYSLKMNGFTNTEETGIDIVAIKSKTNNTPPHLETKVDPIKAIQMQPNNNKVEYQNSNQAPLGKNSINSPPFCPKLFNNGSMIPTTFKPEFKTCPM